jgi:thiosulfate/3-mercaptopyruvate sulfurtransferase
MSLQKKIFTFIVITLVFQVNLFALEAKKIPSVVPLSWIKENISNKNLVIIDLREEKEYQKGHIKGAVNIPGLQNLFEKDDWMMPKLDYLKKLFSNAGIDKDTLVVAYDNGDFFWSARLYWILEVLGHHNVGISKYAYGKEMIKTLPISKTTTKNKPKDFIPRVDDSQIETKLSTLMSIGKKTIVDGRAKQHFEGKESISKRYGHIPTAKNYACTNNFQVSGNGNYMKEFDELAKIYKNIPKDKEIILYCQGGAESALNYIVLKELGYKTSIYDGSWKEWGNDANVPIVNPSKK